MDERDEMDKRSGEISEDGQGEARKRRKLLISPLVPSFPSVWALTVSSVLPRSMDSEESQKKKFVEWLQGQTSTEEQQKTLAKIAGWRERIIFRLREVHSLFDAVIAETSVHLTQVDPNRSYFVRNRIFGASEEKLFETGAHSEQEDEGETGKSAAAFDGAFDADEIGEDEEEEDSDPRIRINTATDDNDDDSDGDEEVDFGGERLPVEREEQVPEIIVTKDSVCF
eukprot:TRINITY_DN183_c0_g1_i11.p1 TRINITY_DN183_c0_g1~~TRINITY_DN183_c0_g1_i11.p1  ORF type:complete len:226 (+),score=80.30 TRINITY_DN183_c0_g1_i11:73-750(+)